MALHGPLAIDALLFRLEAIQLQVDPEAIRAKDEAAKSSEDEFTKLKHQVSDLVQQIRQRIDERDSSLASDGNSELVVRLSQDIRSDIKTLFADIDQLQLEAEKFAHRNRKKRKKDSRLDELIEQRLEIVDVARRHAEECEELERRRFDAAQTAASARGKLLTRQSKKGGSGGGGGGGKSGKKQRSAKETDLPDIDVEEGFRQQEENEKEIDAALDRIHAGVGRLREQAQGFSETLDMQLVMIDTIGTKIEDNTEKMKHLNERMREQLDKHQSPMRLLVNVCCCLVILGCAAFIWQIFVRK